MNHSKYVEWMAQKFHKDFVDGNDEHSDDQIRDLIREYVDPDVHTGEEIEEIGDRVIEIKRRTHNG